MLLTTDEPSPGDPYGGPARVVVGWMEPYATFTRELKKLTASGAKTV